MGIHGVSYTLVLTLDIPLQHIKNPAAPIRACYDPSQNCEVTHGCFFSFLPAGPPGCPHNGGRTPECHHQCGPGLSPDTGQYPLPLRPLSLPSRFIRSPWACSAKSLWNAPSGIPSSESVPDHFLAQMSIRTSASASSSCWTTSSSISNRRTRRNHRRISRLASTTITTEATQFVALISRLVTIYRRMRKVMHAS